MSQKKIAIVLIISCIFPVSAFSSNLVEANSSTDPGLFGDDIANWTVMMYLACDTSLRSRLIDFYIGIFTSIGSDNDFNIVALIDGVNIGDTSYYYVEKGLLVPLTWYESESNMASPENFERFLELTMYNYPADHYALFTLADYGSGWQGIFSDTSGGGGPDSWSLITMPEVSDVLKKVTNNGTGKIDFYGIDVCIPGTVEVAYQIAPYVDYMVANQEHGFEGFFSDEGFLIGWNYSYYLQELKDNPDMMPEQFATLVVESFQPGTLTQKIFNVITAPKWYPVNKYHVTLSATNLSRIDLVKNAVNTLAANLTKNLKDVKHEIKATRSKTREYGKLYRKFWRLPRILYGLSLEPLSYDCFIDLYDFVNKLKNETENQEIKNACYGVMDAINTTIMANKVVPTDPSHGLSIYFPELRCLYDQSIWRTIGGKNFRKIPSPYGALYFTEDTTWDEFLKEYLNI